jgi:hypothetical protein
MMPRSPVGMLILFLCLMGSASEVPARIKLITLPVREYVAIEFDHPDVTLVEEERVVPLLKGVNQVDFSFANTHIDPETLVFRVVAPVGSTPLSVKVLSVSYPPGENALVWSVYASGSGAARVRISYALGGLDKDFHYRAVAAHDEKVLTLFQNMRVNNNANEEYESASLWPGFGERFVKTLGLDETKELLVGKYTQVPIQKTYSCNPTEYGYLVRAQDKLNVPMHYVLKNDAAHGLGRAALPAGKARIFQDDGKGGTAFIGEDWGKFTPLDEELRLYLGLARDVVVRRTVEHNERSRIAGNLYDYDVVVKYEIENFKDSPVTLDVGEDIRQLRSEVRGDTPRDPEWQVASGTTLGEPDPERTNAGRLLFHVGLPARAHSGKAQKVVHRLHLTLKNEW